MLMSRSNRPIKETVTGPGIGALMRLAWRRVRQRIYAGVCAEGYSRLKPAHVGLFRYEGLEGRRPTQLAEQMQMSKQAINELLRHLERLGYLELKTDPDDRRARRVSLTDRGRRLDARVRDYAHAAEDDLARELGRRRFREFRETLAIIARRGKPPEDSRRGKRRKGAPGTPAQHTRPARKR